MRKNRLDEILNCFLKAPNTQLSLDELSNNFGLSKRQITNYIKQINHITKPHEMLKNYNGKLLLCDNYRDFLHLFDIFEYSPKNRQSAIISKLLSADKIDIFDLADELYVSRPTVESDLLKIKKNINGFDLKIISSNDEIMLIGTENNKRKLVSSLITNEKMDNFTSSNNTYLNTHYQTDLIKNELVKIFDKHHFIYNDYSLNNIILHIIIIIDRIKNNKEIIDALPTNLITEVEKQVTIDIIDFLESNYGVCFSKTETKNLSLFLSCNLATIDYNFVNNNMISEYVTSECQELTNSILESIKNYYFIDDLDNVFISRFSLHINNLLKRLHSNYSARNPLKKEIMISYPLVYDIAVFIANIIYNKTNFIINDDEISLIALHIGGFIETKQKEKKLLTCTYVYNNYHNFYKYNIEKIQKSLSDILNIKYSISASDFSNFDNQLKTDLIISESQDISGALFVSPFLKNEELDFLRDNSKLLLSNKLSEKFMCNLKRLFTEKIFYKNICGNDKYDIISLLLDKIKTQNYIGTNFTKEVLQREKIASTYFNNGLAIPHAISQDVKNSFISICGYENPVAWDDHKVKLVVIIGIAYHDRKIFRDVFNKIINVLSNERNVLTLSRCENYNDIVKNIENMTK